MGLTQLEVANALGTTRSYCNRIENAKVPSPPTYLLKKLSGLFKCDFTEFRDIADEERIGLKQREARKKTAALGLDVSDAKHAFRLVPVLNSTSTGKLIDYADMEYPPGIAEEYYEFKVNDPNAFFLRAEGDCMAPEIKKGDLLLISPNEKVESGDMAAVVNGKGEKEIRRITIREDQMILAPENPVYPVIVWEKKDKPKIIGRVKEIIRRR